MDDAHLPLVDTESEPFWSAGREGRLLIKHCRACDKNYFYPRHYCPHCWSEDTEWIQASGSGVVYTYSIVHQNPGAPFRDWGQYAVVIADLDEGVRFMANWARDLDFTGLAVGARVNVEWESANDQISLPRFRPAGA